ncbi:MAG: hypothetical protein AAGB22_07275, partial [Bacteroidota bacterium]
MKQVRYIDKRKTQRLEVVLDRDLHPQTVVLEGETLLPVPEEEGQEERLWRYRVEPGELTIHTRMMPPKV